MAIPFPFLLIMGALGLKALSGKNSAQRTGRCTVKSVLGTDHAPLASGGYPRLAAAYVEEWLESPKSIKDSSYYQNMASQLASAEREWQKALGVWQEINTVDGEGMSELPDPDPAIDAALEVARKARRQASSSAITASWAMADKILESIGCPKVTGSSEGVAQLLENEEAWLRWLLAIGVTVNLTSYYTGEADDWPVPDEIVFTAFQFINAHFRKGLSEDPGQEKIEVAQYASALRPLLAPLPGAVKDLRAYQESIGTSNLHWLFGSLLTGAQPWTGLEDKLQNLTRLVSIFMTGGLHDPNLEGWMLGNKIAGWAAIEITGRKPKTDEGLRFFGGLCDYVMDPGWPMAYPSWSVLSGQMGVGGLEALQGLGKLPFSSVRGSLNEAFWEEKWPEIQQEIESSGSVETATVRFLGEMSDSNELEYIYPSYKGWFEKNPGADYEDYLGALAAFEEEYPIIAVAISNLHTYFEARNSGQMGDWGFGG